MLKSLAKFRSNKDRSKKDLTEDGHITATTKSKIGKERSKPRNANKRKKGVNSLASQSSAENLRPSSQEESQTLLENHADVHHLKGKRRVSKRCEEAVNLAVSDFFNCAWKACAERFYITVAATTVSFELRNTWLRIVEAEWQDPDMREKQTPKGNRIFKKDDPPLPLAFDTWSRGALEHLPRIKRESVLDPFLRDLDPLRLPSFTSTTTTTTSESRVTREDTMEPIKGEAEYTTLGNEVSTGDEKKESYEHIPEKDRWNFDLDKPLSESESRNEAEYEEADELTEEESQEAPVPNEPPEVEKIYTLFSARHNLNVSTSAIECYSPLSTGGEKSIRRSKAKKSRSVNGIGKCVSHFSPSLCGGPNRSGVFRLPGETTTEAITERRRTRDNYNIRTYGPKIEEQEGEDRGDIAQVVKKGAKLNDDNEGLAVHPLFEENTHPVERETSMSHRFQEGIRMVPSFSTAVSQRTSLEVVASSINKKFLRRRLVDLHGRFKRQIIRSVATRAKQLEAIMLEDSLSSSPRSELSLISISSKKSPKNKSASTATIRRTSGNNPAYSAASRHTIKGAFQEAKVAATDDKRKKSIASSVYSRKTDRFSFKPLMGNVRPSNRDDHKAAGKARQ